METVTKICECGQPAITSYWKTWSRHALKVDACLACALKTTRQIDVYGKTIKEVCDELSAILKEEKMEEEGVHAWSNMLGDLDAKVPEKFRWVAVYPVTGSNEGHYIHMDFILGGYHLDGSNQVMHLATIKTFGGWDRAWEVASRVAYLLGA